MSQRPIPEYAVNPALQIDAGRSPGSFISGLCALLSGVHGEGRRHGADLRHAQLVRIAEMPQWVDCDAKAAASGALRPDDLPSPSAVLNAMLAATGKRYRTFPLSHHNIVAVQNRQKGGVQPPLPPAGTAFMTADRFAIALTAQPKVCCGAGRPMRGFRPTTARRRVSVPGSAMRRAQAQRRSVA